jgi:hypothetical protein
MPLYNLHPAIPFLSIFCAQYRAVVLTADTPLHGILLARSDGLIPTLLRSRHHVNHIFEANRGENLQSGKVMPSFNRPKPRRGGGKYNVSYETFY